MTVLSGNRSGDLDSLVSSFVTGELRKLIAPGEAVKILVWFDPADWKLHRDALFLLRSCGFDTEDFISFESFEAIAGNQPVALILTDHNRPERELVPYEDRITAITDHHALSGPVDRAVKLTHDNTGSCCTLVAEDFLRFLEENPLEISGASATSLAELLYFTIRIDTDHLADTGQYNLGRDREALKKLKPLLAKEESFLAALQEEKENREGFALSDHLARDFKFWKAGPVSYGISTIQCPVGEFFPLMAADPLSAGFFMEKQGISLLFLMHFRKTPILKRELTVIPAEGFARTAELTALLERTELFTEMGKEKNLAAEHYRYSQKNPHLSRKKIQPALDGIIKELLEK